MTGWKQEANQCLHLGLMVAALTVPFHAVGHEWECSCGQVFVVAMRRIDGKPTKVLVKS